MCGSDTYLVHKAIICPQSDFFRAACRPDTFAEGKSNVINIPASSGRDEAFYLQPFETEDFEWDLDVETTTSVKMMIHYFYHHDYHVEAADATPKPILFSFLSRKGILSEHARMYAIGEEYGIPGLKTVARDKFEKLCVKKYHHRGLPTAIIIVFNTTPETDKSLREIILKAVYRCRRDYKDEEEIQQLISSISELGYGLFRAMLECETTTRR